MIALIVGVVVFSAAIVVIALVGGGRNDGEAGSDDDTRTNASQKKESLDELSVESVEEQGDAVVVSTTYCTLKYPFAFADLIRVEAIDHEGSAALEFIAEIDGVSYKLYTILFGSSAGIPVGTIELGEDEEEYDVNVLFHELEEEVGESERTTFYATQETFNDVVASMAENENFTLTN